MRKILVLLALFITIIVSSISFSLTDNRIKANVVSVVDGDTIHIQYDVQGVVVEDTVRLISVDTPECTKKFKKNPQAGAIDAKNFTEKYCGKVVYLELDKDNRDMFGRLLCYVYDSNDGKFSSSLNYELVKNKLAKVKYYKPNGKHLKELNVIK